METTSDPQLHDTALDRRLHDVGWGLLLRLAGAVWLVPGDAVPAGTWFVGVAAILLGLNVIRYLNHVPINGFSLALGIAACAAAVSQIWGTDLPLVAIFLLVIGASHVVKPLLARDADGAAAAARGRQGSASGPRRLPARAAQRQLQAAREALPLRAAQARVPVD
jgi:hypothetical protein